MESSLGAGDRDEFGEGLGRDDDAGGVDARSADEAFEAQCSVDELLDLRVGVVGLAERAFVLSALSMVMPIVAGIILAMRSTSPYGISSARPTSLIAAFAAMVLKVMICATWSRAVLARDVLDDLAAAVHAEVDIDIGHGDAFGVEEALEEQLVLEGIDVGDLHAVGDQRSGSGAAAWARRGYSAHGRNG